MQPNPLLKKLGLSNTDRAIILHADDIGMCQAALTAYQDLIDFGLLSAAAVMVPCPWFPATASFCKAKQAEGKIDMGVHLTLTSEWEGYRWGPISTANPASGLLDKTGYFYNNTADVQNNATTEAVTKELKAQIDRALAAGIDVTHIDSHMFAIFPTFTPIYAQLAFEYKVPAFLTRITTEQLIENGYDADTASTMVKQLQELEGMGLPLLDGVLMTPLDEHENRLEATKQILQAAQPGITYFITHPSHNTPELQAIAPDWQARVADYELLNSAAFRDYLNDEGFHIIGYRALRDLWREGNK